MHKSPPHTRHINPHPPLLPPSPPSWFLLLIFPWSLPLFICIIPTLAFCSSFLPCYCFMSLYLSVTSSYTLTEQRTGDPPSCLPPVLGYSFALSLQFDDECFLPWSFNSKLDAFIYDAAVLNYMARKDEGCKVRTNSLSPFCVHKMSHFYIIHWLSVLQGDDHRLGEGFCHHRLRHRPAQKLTLETSSWPGPSAAGGRR